MEKKCSPNCYWWTGELTVCEKMKNDKSGIFHKECPYFQTEKQHELIENCVTEKTYSLLEILERPYLIKTVGISRIKNMIQELQSEIQNKNDNELYFIDNKDYSIGFLKEKLKYGLCKIRELQ